MDATDDFSRIYREHAPAVMRYLLYLSGNASTAAELTAETFYQAIVGADRFRGESSLRMRARWRSIRSIRACHREKVQFQADVSGYRYASISLSTSLKSGAGAEITSSALSLCSGLPSSPHRSRTWLPSA
jgi:hypothetical protein